LKAFSFSNISFFAKQKVHQPKLPHQKTPTFDHRETNPRKNIIHFLLYKLYHKYTDISRGKMKNS